jgi:hypothetical protein
MARRVGPVKGRLRSAFITSRLEGRCSIQLSYGRTSVRAFDNLYYVGLTEIGAWAVTTSEGIIIIV